MSRTVIDIQDDLLRKAQKLMGISKKVEIVNYALKRLLEQKEMEQILELRQGQMGRRPGSDEKGPSWFSLTPQSGSIFCSMPGLRSPTGLKG